MASCWMSVRDSGIGIAPEMVPHIFELFVQERQAVARAEGGLGIGLTIVRSLVELHGGSVSVRSDGVGKGTEFIVGLPAAATEPANPLHTPIPRPHSAPDVGGQRSRQGRDRHWNESSRFSLCEWLKNSPAWRASSTTAARELWRPRSPRFWSRSRSRRTPAATLSS